jgi:hypothetical protein
VTTGNTAEKATGVGVVDGGMIKGPTNPAALVVVTFDMIGVGVGVGTGGQITNDGLQHFDLCLLDIFLIFFIIIVFFLFSNLYIIFYIFLIYFFLLYFLLFFSFVWNRNSKNM